MKLNLRCSTFRDEARIADFYSENSHENFVFRVTRLGAISRDGNFAVCELDQRIVGCCAILPHVDQDGRIHVELCQDRIILNGYNLHRCLTYYRLKRIGEIYPKHNIIFGQVNKSNIKMQKLVISLGGTYCELDKEIRSLAIAALPANKTQEVMWFKFPESTIRQAIEYFEQARNTCQIVEEGKMGSIAISLKWSGQP